MGPGELVPLAGMATAIIIMVVVGRLVGRVFTGPIGQAIGRRIHGRGGELDPEVLNELADLRQQLEQTQQRLLDAEERLDFSERLLAQRPVERIGQGPQ